MLRPHHPHPHHRRHSPPGAFGEFVVQLQELLRRGAPEEAAHDIIDKNLAARLILTGATPPNDPGRGTPEEPIGALQRAQTLFAADRQASIGVFDGLRSKLVLVVGPFPPHLLDTMLMYGIRVMQLHERTPHGWAPPHFAGLGHRGLNGVTEISDILQVTPDALAVHAGAAGDSVLVGADFVVVRRLFPTLPVYALVDQHCPHAVCAVDAKDFIPFPWTA